MEANLNTPAKTENYIMEYAYTSMGESAGYTPQTKVLCAQHREADLVRKAWKVVGRTTAPCEMCEQAAADE